MIGENGRKSRRWFMSLGLLAAGVLATAAGGLAAADDDKAKTDAVKAFQGDWVSAENEGIEAKWSFEGEKVKTMVAGMDYTSKLTVNPAAKPHSTLDLMIEDGPEDSKGKVSKGIYKVEGDKLTICISVPGKDRPKDFEQVEDECYRSYAHNDILYRLRPGRFPGNMPIWPSLNARTPTTSISS